MPPDTAHAKAGAVPGQGEAGAPHAGLPLRPSPSPGLFPEVLVPTLRPPPSCPELCSKPRVPKADLEPLEVSPSLNFASSGSVGAGGGDAPRWARASGPSHLLATTPVPHGGRPTKSPRLIARLVGRRHRNFTARGEQERGWPCYLRARRDAEPYLSSAMVTRQPGCFSPRRENPSASIPSRERSQSSGVSGLQNY